MPLAETLVVVCRVTEACNLACGFCRYDRTQTFARKLADPKMLCEFGRELAAYQAATSTRVLVSLLGGEPFLWSPLREVCEHLKALALDVSITTNGSRLRQFGLDAIRRLFSELTLSIDGIGVIHDEVRGWTGGYASLHGALEELAHFPRHARPLLRVNVVLMRETIGDFFALCHTLADVGCDEVTFNSLGGADRPEFYRTHSLLPEQVRRFAEELPTQRALLATRGLIVAGGDSYLERIIASAEGVRLPAGCKPGKSFLFVDENGRASPCSYTQDLVSCALPASISQLRDALSAQRLRSQPAACEDCHSTQVHEKFSRADSVIAPGAGEPVITLPEAF